MNPSTESLFNTHQNFFCFADLRKLLAPGFSLAQLCETVGLTMAKGLFPHDLVDPEGRFLDEPELPANAKDWFNRLDQRSPSQREVDAARQLFREKQFTSVRQYYLYYLDCDLIILLESLERFFKELHTIVGLHPVACNKLTVSSFAFLAAQYQLVHDLRPGCFSVNHCAMYAALKRGTRGGVPVVCRTACGNDPAMEKIQGWQKAEARQMDRDAEREERGMERADSKEEDLSDSEEGEAHLLSEEDRAYLALGKSACNAHLRTSEANSLSDEESVSDLRGQLSSPFSRPVSAGSQQSGEEELGSDTTTVRIASSSSSDSFVFSSETSDDENDYREGEKSSDSNDTPSLESSSPPTPSLSPTPPAEARPPTPPRPPLPEPLLTSSPCLWCHYKDLSLLYAAAGKYILCL